MCGQPADLVAAPAAHVLIAMDIGGAPFGG